VLPQPPEATPSASAPTAAAFVAPSGQRATSVRATRTARSAAAASADREDDLYGVAHRAHFVERDPAASLRAWDAYLAAYPEGRFALEARYNRALSLVRLGRIDEARDALEPFADGRYGGYRAREARDLLDALDAGAAPAR
jgi:hypothetical protein